MKNKIRLLFAFIILHSSFILAARAQGTAFSYQGKLNDSGNPANGIYDVRFTVCDALTNGNILAGPLTNSATAVSNGLFSVTLDFGGGVFTGPARWLQLDVRTNGNGAFTSLAPRELLLPVPYAIMASSASNLLGTLPAAQLSGTLAQAQLPSVLVTNNANNVILSGTFNGSGSGLTGLNPANLTAGTAGINISGNAATATTAVNVTGNISDTQLSTNIARLNGMNNFLGVTVATNVNNVFQGSFTGNGGGLTNLNATIPSTINLNSITLGATNVIAPLTVPPTVPSSAIGSVTAGVSSGGPVAVAVAGRYAYVVNGGPNGNTLQIFDVSIPSAPVSVGSVSAGYYSGSIVVAGRYAYVANVAGDTLQIFDVGNPSVPISVGSVGTGLYPLLGAVSGRYAYVVNGGANTLQIFDVGNPSAPVSVGSVSTGSEPNCVAVSGRYAYVVNGVYRSTSTLQIFDVGNPSAPVSVGSVSTGTGSDATYVAVSGSYAYVVNQYASTLQIFDVSSPSAPVSVGSVGTVLYPLFVAVSGRYAYVTSWGASTLQVFDVSNPSAPASVGSTSLNGIQGVAVSGRYAYCVGANSLQIFDLGGAYIQQLEAGTMETGTLQTRDTATVGNNLDVRGGLTVSGSARISGGLNLGGITTNILTSSSGGHTLYITNGIIMNVQ